VSRSKNQTPVPFSKKTSPSTTSKKSSPTTKIQNEVEKFVNKSPEKNKRSPVQMDFVPVNFKRRVIRSFKRLLEKMFPF
jgi:DNA transposition AAA+ family ATPase